jgi:hypothetical protein
MPAPNEPAPSTANARRARACAREHESAAAAFGCVASVTKERSFLQSASRLAP